MKIEARGTRSPIPQRCRQHKESAGVASSWGATLCWRYTLGTYALAGTTALHLDDRPGLALVFFKPDKEEIPSQGS